MDKPEKPTKPNFSDYGVTESSYNLFLNTKTVFTPWNNWYWDVDFEYIVFFFGIVSLIIFGVIFSTSDFIVATLILTTILSLFFWILFLLFEKLDVILIKWVLKKHNINYEKCLRLKADLASYEYNMEKYEREYSVYRYQKNQAEKEEKEAIDKEQRRKEFSYWFELDPYEFEREIAELFIKHQFRAEPTKGSGDEGIDILLEFGNGYKGIAQCKRQKTKVSPSVIRDIYGTMMSGKFKYAFVICPAGFSDKSFEFAKGKKIILIGQKRLMQMLNENPYSLDFLEV